MCKVFSLYVDRLKVDRKDPHPVPDTSPSSYTEPEFNVTPVMGSCKISSEIDPLACNVIRTRGLGRNWDMYTLSPPPTCCSVTSILFFPVLYGWMSEQNVGEGTRARTIDSFSSLMSS